QPLESRWRPNAVPLPVNNRTQGGYTAARITRKRNARYDVNPRLS
ncbi:hypothetical protein APX70_04134, partial [Pseudomonas syringae pv. maculicola]